MLILARAVKTSDGFTHFHAPPKSRPASQHRDPHASSPAGPLASNTTERRSGILFFLQLLFIQLCISSGGHLHHECMRNIALSLGGILTDKELGRVILVDSYLLPRALSESENVSSLSRK